MLCPGSKIRDCRADGLRLVAMTQALAAIRRGGLPDLLVLMRLLQSAGLPTEDLTRTTSIDFWIIEADGSIVGTIGLERFEKSGLLRSLAVAPEHRRHGLGRQLVERLERDAYNSGIDRLVLLTETAERFFAGLGYSVTGRQSAPDAVRGSAEFRNLCPASAVCMTKSLSARPQEGTMPGRPYNVLFLCTGNSARSVLAESLLNHWGQGRFRGYSAGSFPKGQIHPISIALLNELGLPTEGLRSKSWDEFAAPGAPPIDFVFTVCDNAAGEVCPVWPGHPMTAHWGIEDPAAIEGPDDEKWAAFGKALRELESRIKVFVNLPITNLEKMTLQSRLIEIGKTISDHPSAV